MDVTLRVNLVNQGVTQHHGVHANSYCTFKGHVYGASDNGIFRLDDAATDDFIDAAGSEQDINSWIEFPVSNFGDAELKRARKLILHGSFSESVWGSIKARGYREVTKNFTATPRLPGDYQMLQIPLSSEAVGREFIITLGSNEYLLVEHADFQYQRIKARGAARV